MKELNVEENASMDFETFKMLFDQQIDDDFIDDESVIDDEGSLKIKVFQSLQTKNSFDIAKIKENDKLLQIPNVASVSSILSVRSRRKSTVVNRMEIIRRVISCRDT